MVMDRYRIRKPSGPRERKAAAAARRCPSCRQIWAVCDCRRLAGRDRSQSTSGTSPMSQSSPETTESKITSPGDLSLTSGALESLPPEITAAFFSFVGDSPSPLTDVFSLSFLRTYLNTSIPIRAVVTTIGKMRMAYAKKVDLERRQAAAVAVMTENRPKLKEFLDLLTSPESHDEHLMLLYGILLAYAECMVGASWLLFQSTIRKLAERVQERLKQDRRRPLLYFDRGLLMNFALMAGYYPLISFEDTFLVDVDLYDPTPFASIDSQTSQVRMNAAILHHYCKYVAHFARLHHRATKWVRQARQVVADCQEKGGASEEDLKQALVHSGLIQVGTEVIESSASVIDVMEMLKGGDDDDEDSLEKGDFGTLREAFYHFALMGLTRTFWDPTWKLVDEDLPHMRDMPDLEAHGIFVLERLEHRTPLLGMEAWSYLVILMGIALEVRKPEYRERVAVLITDIREKGFAIAGSFLTDVRLLWGIDYASQHDNSIGPSC